MMCILDVCETILTCQQPKNRFGYIQYKNDAVEVDDFQGSTHRRTHFTYYMVLHGKWQGSA